ncbi:MAG: hypothetical protein NC300_02730 [Bacteroidales bacterium]|nr:hypothetical protein [Clostridium sp.]MCM1203034.1 hypothetical protein [Bacteroidales bacterium]
MNFISERIEREEDIEYIHSLGFWDSTGKNIPSWWVIDRDSGVFLFFCGGRASGMPQRYGLCIDKELVEMEALSWTKGDTLKSNLIVHWIIGKIDIPVNLIKKGYVEEDIIYTIEKAFTALGLLGIERKDIADTSVEITVSPKIINRGSKKEEQEDLLKKKDVPFNDDMFFLVLLVSAVVGAIIAFKYNIDSRRLIYLLGAISTIIYLAVYYIIKKIK